MSFISWNSVSASTAAGGGRVGELVEVEPDGTPRTARRGTACRACGGSRPPPRAPPSTSGRPACHARRREAQERLPANQIRSAGSAMSRTWYCIISRIICADMGARARCAHERHALRRQVGRQTARCGPDRRRHPRVEAVGDDVVERSEIGRGSEIREKSAMFRRPTRSMSARPASMGREREVDPANVLSGNVGHRDQCAVAARELQHPAPFHGRRATSRRASRPPPAGPDESDSTCRSDRTMSYDVGPVTAFTIVGLLFRRDRDRVLHGRTGCAPRRPSFPGSRTAACAALRSTPPRPCPWPWSRRASGTS